MPKQILALDSIGDVDSGGLRIEFNNALKRLTQDMADRPLLDRPRTLTLEIELRPVADLNSNAPTFDHSKVAWQIKTKAPAVSSKDIVMKSQQDGRLYFHSELPDAPDDETIHDEAERRRRERDGGR